MSLPGGLFPLRTLAILFLGTLMLFCFALGLLSTSIRSLLSRFYCRVGLIHKQLDTPVVFFFACFPLLPLFSAYSFLTRLPLTGLLCLTLSFGLCTFSVAPCCAAASHIRHCFAYVTGAPATRAITTSPSTVAANAAIHKPDVVPPPTMPHEVHSTERA